MKLLQGDCLELMCCIKDKSIDMILCDLPYGATKNSWDIIIPFEQLWNHYNRIIKDNGVILLFGQNIFTAKCIISNEKYFRYTLVWKKGLTTGFLNANRMPLREHEDIMVFYKKLPTYNPQKIKGNPCHTKGKIGEIPENNNIYGNFKYVQTVGDMKFPKSIIEIQKQASCVCVHPTQKPVELLEYLIKTYTNESELVLDNCMGSGSTGIACQNTNRRFIGIEKDKQYYNIAVNRLLQNVTNSCNLL